MLKLTVNIKVWEIHMPAHMFCGLLFVQARLHKYKIAFLPQIMLKSSLIDAAYYRNVTWRRKSFFGISKIEANTYTEHINT